jgi:hypothetical protein
MVRDLLYDAWARLRSGVRLEQMTAAQKRELFERVQVVFPMERRDRTPSTDTIITVDFHSGRRAQTAGRCPCGSGLRFMSCCGRLPDVRQLLGGSL